MFIHLNFLLNIYPICSCYVFMRCNPQHKVERFPLPPWQCRWCQTCLLQWTTRKLGKCMKPWRSDVEVVSPAAVSEHLEAGPLPHRRGRAETGPHWVGTAVRRQRWLDYQSTISTDKPLHKPVCVSCRLSADGRQNSSRPHSGVRGSYKLNNS